MNALEINGNSRKSQQGNRRHKKDVELLELKNIIGEKKTLEDSIAERKEIFKN